MTVVTVYASFLSSMSLLDSLIGQIGLIRKSNIPATLGGLNGGNPMILGSLGSSKKISAAKAMGANTDWVYACVRAISEEIGNAQLRLFEIKSDGKSEELFEHEILATLEGVNNYQTGYELKYLIGSYLELAGNAYLLLDGVTDAKGKPTAIYPLNPAYIRVIRGDLRDPIKGYIYTEPGKAAEQFYPYQILHLKYPDPNDLVEGLGTVQAIARWIDAESKATEWNAAFFANGARIGGFLDTPNALNKEQMQFLRANFEDMYKGTANAYRVAVLPAGVKYTPGSDSVKELDFNASQSTQRDKILAGFRVPKTILGASESETNRATAETANYVFAARTITPKLTLIASYLNEFFVPRYGAQYYVEFANVIPEDRTQRVAEMTAATGSQPVISVNEAREGYLGLGAVEHGEDVMTDFSKIPLGAPINKTAAPRLKKQVKKSRGFVNFQRRNKLSGDIAEKAVTAVAKALSRKNGIAALSDEQYEVIWKNFNARVTGYEKLMVSMLRDYNEIQQKEVLKNLESATKTKDVDEDRLFEIDDWVGALTDAATPILTDLYVKEGKEAAKLLGRDDINVLTPETKKALAKAIELMSQSYNDTTLTALKAKLEEGLQQGASQPEMKKLVQDVYEFSDATRALSVARTETFRVANGATHEAWKESGVVESMKWYTAVDDRVCEFCDPMMGEIVGIEETFFDKGETIEGRDGGTLAADYGDIQYPPLHPQCRCYIRPEKITI